VQPEFLRNALIRPGLVLSERNGIANGLEWIIAFENKPSKYLETNATDVDPAPADCPNTVTLLASPLNDGIFFF